MVAQGSEVTLGVREQALIDVLLDGLALDFERVAGKLEEVVEALEERFFAALEKVPEARAVDRHHAEAARLLGRTKEAVAAL